MTFMEELVLVLKKELDVLKDLKELTFEKTDLIINNQIKELEATTKKEEDLINQVALLEEEREKLLDTWGVGPDTPISNIIERIPGDKGDLPLIKDEMHHVMEELFLRNKLNRDLIEENLQWIDFNINLISNMQVQPSYGKDTKDSKVPGKSIFDRKV
ncbi:MAG: flagellar protein FlgN [Tissierellia bacterium]|nr:flagellar protein FlgN [Tissierellia bacterium]